MQFFPKRTWKDKLFLLVARLLGKETELFAGDESRVRAYELEAMAQDVAFTLNALIEDETFPQEDLKPILAELGLWLIQNKQSTLSTLNRLQYEHAKWEARNFPDVQNHHPILGAAEEVGELCHAYLKMEQGIRGDRDELVAEMKDAIGDATVFLSSLCNKYGWDYQKIVSETWAQVKDRDWVKYPKNGKTA